MRTGRHRRFSRLSLALGAQRKRCKNGIHVAGESHEIGAGIRRTLCRACGAVAALDLRDLEEGLAGAVELRQRKPLWE